VSSGGAIALLGVFFGLIVISGPLMLRSITRLTPWGISRRLRAGGASVVRRSRYAAGVWDPAKPLGRGNATPNVPGWVATYSLTADGMIKLDLVHADGRREQRVGPPVDAPQGWQRTTTFGLLPALSYLIGVGAGLGVGAAVGGSTAAVTGAIVGFAITWLGLTMLAARGRARTARRSDSQDSAQTTNET
jgi:hypothetical protein